MRCALLQINSTVGDISGNAERITAAFQAAVRRGAQLCVTPELALTGYPPRDLLLYPAFVDAAERALADLAAQTGDCALVVGVVARNTSGVGRPLHNQAVFAHQGQVRARYAKRLLPTYDVFDEARYFEPGKAPCVVEHAGACLAITVCEDIWNDSGTALSYAVDPLAEHPPFDVLVNLSASPFTVGKQYLRERMLISIAGKYGVQALYVNCAGGNDDLVFDGRSLYATPRGIVGRAAAFAEDTLFVVCPVKADGVPKSEITRAQNASLLTEDDFTPKSEIMRALCTGLADYCAKTGHRSVVLGLSGGVDSALVAVIACEAVGHENVHALLMPSPWSSAHSLTDALSLSRNLGMATTTLPIEGAMKAYDAILAETFAGRMPDVTEENLQARIRGNLLMAYANKFGSLLLTTGNKSELSIGYCTLYGDMCGALAVIGDLYKTEVYRLCRWINARAGLVGQDGQLRGVGVIPENILVKPPSAELRPGQTDQDSLPPYDELDAILQHLLEERLSVADSVAAGHDQAVVDRVARLVRLSEFKRRQAAPVLKITRQAFGVGWRMPVACQYSL
ncbi:MAG: glutamine-dependent NAD+ synthetase [Candidatus Desulfovibrio kirbyi]|uniref:Glutamine-dependent NAD(+) synthetase n=2 Tax=Candidatus Desulfovibrio kirbyi TaxID=2696086 RepID=A0A6L2R698_9BACT|nr:MAG: glutamine-dependent NAD+ synthetase [Candidatus Desulfovibrio kirbyi]